MSGPLRASEDGGRAAWRAGLAAALVLVARVAAAQGDRVLVDPAPCQPGALVATTLFGRALAVLGSDLAVSARGAGCDSVLAGHGLVYRLDATTGSVVRTFPDPTPGTGDFGAAIAPLGGDLVVGAPDDLVSGTAYLLDGTTGSVLRTFASPAPSAGDRFGSAVCAVGGTVLVGAPLDDSGAPDQGAAYLYDAGSGAIVRAFANPAPGTRFFGSAVAALGGNVLVGAPSFSDPGGAVHLFDAASGALRRTFPNPTGASSSFGVTVAAVGTAVLVGAPREAPGAVGAAYLFDSASGALLHTFLDPRPEPSDGFGSAVVALGTDVLVGAPGLLATADGAAYLFDGDPASPTFGRLRQTFLKAHLDLGVAPGNFGVALAALGTEAVVGAPGYASNLAVSAGAVYRFDACGNGVRGAGEECDDGNRLDGDGCTSGCALELCGVAPASGCHHAGASQSTVTLKRAAANPAASPPFDRAKDQLAWRWGGTVAAPGELGNPRTTTSYALCVYDASGAAQPLVRAAAPAGGACGPRACWQPSGALRYRDPLRTPDGLLTVGLMPAPATLLRVHGKGAALALPHLPLTGPVTVQLLDTDTGACWEAVYLNHVRSNTATVFKAASD